MQSQKDTGVVQNKNTVIGASGMKTKEVFQKLFHQQCFGKWSCMINPTTNPFIFKKDLRRMEQLKRYCPEAEDCRHRFLQDYPKARQPRKVGEQKYCR